MDREDFARKVSSIVPILVAFVGRYLTVGLMICSLGI